MLLATQVEVTWVEVVVAERTSESNFLGCCCCYLGLKLLFMLRAAAKEESKKKERNLLWEGKWKRCEE